MQNGAKRMKKSTNEILPIPPNHKAAAREEIAIVV